MTSESLIRQADTQDLESSLSGSNGFNKYGYNRLTIFFFSFLIILYTFLYIFLYTRTLKLKYKKYYGNMLLDSPFTCQ